MSTLQAPMFNVNDLSPADIRKRLAPSRQSDAKIAIWQLVSTITMLAGLVWLMAISLSVGYWLSLLIAIPAAGMLVRLFIIQHDCGHGSFFRSQKANHYVGSALSLFTLTPYYQWRHSHALHHATHGDLDHRGDGDVHTLTVNEYNALSPMKKFGYYLYRHPIVMFGLFPTLLFLVSFRSTIGTPREKHRERASVHMLNLAIFACIVAGCYYFGIANFFMIYLPVIIFASTIGVWMFYVQHQFDPNYWQRHEEWNRVHASLQGSSYYRLPKILQWFTGNIGLHHIHHLDSRIPNYRLQSCLDQNRDLLEVPPLTIASSFRCVNLKLWDEEKQRMVGFKEAKAARQASQKETTAV